MALQKYIPPGDAPFVSVKPFSSKVHEKAQCADMEMSSNLVPDVDIDLKEVYFLIMHFLSTGPCQRTYGQFWNELLEHQLLPRRYHSWYSRNGIKSGDENDNGLSFPLGYNKLVERYPHISTDHLVKLLKQLILNTTNPSRGINGGNAPNAADVPTLLGTETFSLLEDDRSKDCNKVKGPPIYLRWPHMQADQVRALTLREIGGGFSRHHRGPSIRAACYAIAKPSTMVQKMQNIKKLRGHRNAVYCAVFDRSGRHVITGSDDRLVKIWSMETAYCLASCRGHEGDITDLAVSSNNALVASSSNDCIIRVWRLSDGLPISVLRGHIGAVTAISFSPRPGSVYQLLSSSDDGTCRIWDATKAQVSPRIFVPRPSDSVAGRNNAPSTSTGPQTCQIFCCAFNANGSVFVTGSSDKLARVWHASRPNTEDPEQHELDVLSGHENDVNYVQFSGCAVGSKFSMADTSKEENLPKFKNSWFTQENIVTCSRDGSAIIWVPRTRRSHGKVGRWIRAYHLKVPPPPMPALPPRGGPRQRILPTPRGVNMITWSLDNRFVLAAIMDCRICVWNATDGSLVHSLTGHTESTYVLDVHPFNPRIAMSAGYDGKTIVWDIWEGTPIKVYEIAPFKLVDGKFSPDGTSIILSDDVGQLYILNTGQGESQMDAKYDQFFLGDYRPLIQDTHGNVLDKETQLPPYIRNMQDLLCDSAMLPYPEPYQSMYQQRRLGALGIEWRPSLLRLAVGTDITLDQEYQMLPLVDLDMLANPLPEFTHIMDWEPEIEVLSDDTDSEYNVTEGCSSGGDQVSLSSISSGDPGFSEDDSDVENTHKDSLRRSKRKKAKTNITTSSGRRVKRRNLDECDTNSLRNDHSKRSGGRRMRRRKSSISNSLRPQRVAARNALTLFSRITGTHTDREDEDVWEDESSETDSTLQDSNMESEESDGLLPNKQIKHVKGKEVVSLDEPEEVIKPDESSECHTNGGNRRRLLLKFSLRGSNNPGPSESPMSKCDNREDVLGSSSKVCEEAGEVNCNEIVGVRLPSEKVDSHIDLSEGYKNGQIRWGGFKARSYKRTRTRDVMPSDACVGSSRNIINHYQSDSYVDGCINSEMEHVMTPPQGLCGAANGKENSCLNQCSDNSKLPKVIHMAVEDVATSSSQYNNEIDYPPEINIPKRLRLRSKTNTTNPINPSKLNSFGDAWRNGLCEMLSESPSRTEKNCISDRHQCDGDNRTSSDNGDHGLQNVDTRIDNCTEHVLKDAGVLHPSSQKKMFDAVYRRSRTHRVKNNPEADTGTMEESTSNACDINMNTGLDVSESKINESHRTRLTGMEPSMNYPNTRDKFQEILPEQWGRSNSSMLGGLRSTRNRKGSSNLAGASTVDRRTLSGRKQSWLMLTTHEGSRYIPQLGDEVAYLIQGHQEYIDFSFSKDTGPWVSIRNKIRDVEFCKVVGLAYDYVPGSGECCCKMTVKFVDPDSSVFGITFKLTLPEVNSFPDFLVERSRFDAAIKRNWSCRDKCQVWWKNEGDEDGAWWEGRILYVKAKSADFPDSPWERYAIKYKSDPTETHHHSPWELHSNDVQWEQPRIDNVIREKLLSSIAKLNNSGNKAQDQYGVSKLKQVSDKTTFRNRSPVPLSLETIHLRLTNNYYRNLEALKHDISVMLSAAESYFEKNAGLSPKMRRLSEWFTRTLSSL